MMKSGLAVLLTVAAGCVLAGHAAVGAEPVKLTPVAGKQLIKGRLQGRQYVDYQLAAGAGQTLVATLKASHGQNYFNINPPDSEMAMFVGSVSGVHFEGVLPGDGIYTLRVYLMRAAARRQARSDYRLSVELRGQALPALPAAQDALIPGTSFHAAASIPCQVPFVADLRRCDAFVTRRGFDGTATVEVRWGEGLKRRILFRKGLPVASDATVPVGHSRQGDVTVVTPADDERFDIPDALVAGG